jgi:hypothetical protein
MLYYLPMLSVSAYPRRLPLELMGLPAVAAVLA